MPVLPPYAIGTIDWRGSQQWCMRSNEPGQWITSMRLIAGPSGCEFSSGAPEVGPLYPRHPESAAYQWTLEGCWGRIVDETLYIATHPEPGPLARSFHGGFRRVVISGKLSLIGQQDGIHVYQSIPLGDKP